LLLEDKTTKQTYQNNTTSFEGILSTQIITLNNTNLNTRLNTDENDIANLKSKTTNIYYNSTTNKTDLGAIIVSSINLNGTDLNTRLTTDEANIQTNANNIATIENSIINLSSKANDATVVHNTLDENIDGVKTFLKTPFINQYPIATTNDLSTSINNLIGSSSGTYENLTQLSQLLSANGVEINTILNTLTTMVDLTTEQTITGFKTFTNLLNATAIQTQNLITNKLFSPLLNTNTFTTNSIISNKILTTDIICNNIKCLNVEASLHIPNIYLTNQNIQYPIIKSGLISKLTGIDFNYPCYFTVAPNYQIIFFDINTSAIAKISNSTDDYIYNIGISFDISNPPYKFKIDKIII